MTRSLAPALSLLLLLAGAASAQTAPARLPDRLLRCTLGRVTNFDSRAQQTAADLRYEGAHSFTLFLPGGPARTTPPPDPTEKPEPVDPRTRVVSDPDDTLRGTRKGFDRVIDLWPDRVEMTTTIEASLVNMIVLHPIDPAAGTANLFMTQATDLTRFDEAHMFQGPCTVTIGAKASAAR